MDCLNCDCTNCGRTIVIRKLIPGYKTIRCPQCWTYNEIKEDVNERLDHCEYEEENK